VFDDGDNPAEYKPIRDAYILRSEGDVYEKRTGAVENPNKDQIFNSGNSQYVYDGPGVTISGRPRAALNGVYDVAFSLSQKNIKTGKVSDKQFFYRVTIAIKDGKIVGSRATAISEEEFRRITGQKKKDRKDKKKKDNDEDKTAN
jgi:hypothetical protein